MQHAYEQKTIEGLLTVKVVLDEHPDNPRDWDNASKLVCWHRDYTLGDEQPSASPEEWLEDYKAANPGALVVPVYMYEHGGIALNTGGFSCPWDSGQCGYAVISAADMAKEWPALEGEERLAAARACIDSEVETYSAFCNGDVYGYRIYNNEGEHLDSCYGYYGTQEALKEGEAAALALIPEARQAAQEAARLERLEAAAPDMLKALQNALEYLKPLQSTLPQTAATTVALVMMQEAVDKATGEAPTACLDC